MKKKSKKCGDCGLKQKPRQVLEGECRNCGGDLEDVSETRQNRLGEVVDG